MESALSESTENYLETILLLESEAKVVRLKDISKRMQVSMPSVHTALHHLEDRGLVNHERYGYVELTGKGAAAARRIYASHTSLTAFFVNVLGIPGDVAERDACRIEHVISHTTLKSMVTFAKKHRRSARDGVGLDPN